MSEQSSSNEVDMTLVPAYGRDFKSKADVIAAWNAGKDFAIADLYSGGGTYCNRADAERGNVHSVTVRYSQLRKVAVLHLRQGEWL